MKSRRTARPSVTSCRTLTAAIAAFAFASSLSKTRSGRTSRSTSTRTRRGTWPPRSDQAIRFISSAPSAEDSSESNYMQKITPFLWFDDKAEEGVKFYVSIFTNSKIGSITRYGDEGAEVSGRPKGTVMTVTFQLEGQEFMALNGGPHFKFTEAISLLVNCKTQEEVDELWEKLSEGGEKGQCGWLKDKYGLSWQIVPTVLGEMLQDKDARKSERVMNALLKMNKIEINALKQASQFLHPT